MSVLLDSLAAGFDGDEARRAPLDEALRDGLPHARVEAWKYSPLRALERRSFAVAEHVAIDPALLAAIPAPRIVFVNGRFDAELSTPAALPATVGLQSLAQALADPDPRAGNFLQRRYTRNDEVFARLNAALPAMARSCAWPRTPASPNPCTWCSSAHRPLPTRPGTCAISSNCGAAPRRPSSSTTSPPANTPTSAMR